MNMKSSHESSAQVKALKKVLGGAGIWTAIAFALIALVMFSTIRVGHVSGTEVGIMLNKITGKITVIEQSGARIYNGITNDFYTLDKTLQTLVMTETVGKGDRHGRDDLKIKTVDGSDVYVDLKVQYRLMPEMAETVILTSGPDNSFKEKWARDYTRSTCRNYLGELTTEEFYDAAKREEKIILAKQAINEKTRPYGIDIDTIAIPTKPHFYAEYEEMIKKKKLADQAVLEEQSKAQAAKQKQQTRIVEETNITNVTVKRFEGEMQQAIIAAKADADKIMKGSDAYYDRVTIGAEAALYEKKKSAEGILAQRKAEAEGIEALKLALEGEGGRNMVKLEYARKLKNITITGKPFTYQDTVERFEHMRGPLYDAAQQAPAAKSE